MKLLWCLYVVICVHNVPLCYGKQNLVTYGSTIKLMNVAYKVRLHSHDVKYGTGSGQQSVTGTQLQDDVNSHWIVKPQSKKNINRGEPIKCGDTIRLEHLTTSKNLHSHHFSSPLSSNQEVSAYGTEGEGDTGDNWTVICETDYWERQGKVLLRHIDTDAYLSVSGQTYGRPINGQLEVVGTSSISTSYWKAAEGLFIHQNNFNPKELLQEQHIHSEL